MRKILCDGACAPFIYGYTGAIATKQMDSSMTPAKIAAAKALGSIACARGKKCAPALDNDLMKMIEGRQIGDERTVAEMKAWISGWTEKTLSA